MPVELEEALYLGRPCVFFLFLGGSPNSHLSFNDSMMHAACPALGRMIKPVGSWHWCSVLLLLGHLGRYLGALSGEHGAI